MLLVTFALAATPCVVATVDSIPITCDQFLAVAASETSLEMHAGKLDLAARHEVLDGLIRMQLLRAEENRRGFSGGDEVESARLLFAAEREAAAARPLSEAEIEAWWRAHHAALDKPEGVAIERILVGSALRGEVEAKRLAEDARAEIVAGNEFAAVALHYSEAPSAHRGGDEGWVRREGKTTLDPVIVKTAFGMKEEELSPVFMTAEGANVVLVTVHEAAVPYLLEEHREDIARVAKTEQLSNVADALIARLLAASTVTVDETELAALPIGSP